MKILLVDDETKFAMMLSKRLTLRGINIDFVNTAEDAMAKAAKNKYDVAILDVKMPGIGGLELKRKLIDLAPEMKFVFVTGHGSETDYTAGSTDETYYLAKPLQIDTLLKILHEMAE